MTCWGGRESASKDECFFVVFLFSIPGSFMYYSSSTYAYWARANDRTPNSA